MNLFILMRKHLVAILLVGVLALTGTAAVCADTLIGAVGVGGRLGLSAAAVALGGPPVADCNGNDIPDDQELSSNDCNSNGVPDDCDLGIALKAIPIPENSAIPDNNAAGITVGFNVSESGIIADLDLGLVITHTWNGDLIVRLSHGVTTVTVIDRPGLSGGATCCGFNNDGFNVVLDDAAAQPIETFSSGGPTVVGRFSPNEPLAAFNGMDKEGEWELFVSDNAGADTGMLVSWTLDIANVNGEPTSEDCNGNRVPDECDEDCNGNNVPDDCEDFCNDRSRGGCVPDCNFNGIPDECEEDCNNNGIPDDCDLCPGPRGGECSEDCNFNGIPDECESDCNNNGIPDDCDLCFGPRGNECSEDCNFNGIPDECEPDCNDNNVPDDCDINGIEGTLYEDLWPLVGDSDTKGSPARGVGPGGNVADDLHFAGPGMMTAFSFGYVNNSSGTVTTTIEFYSNNAAADPNSDFAFIAGFEFNLSPSSSTTVFHDGFAPVALPQDVWMAFGSEGPVVRGGAVRPLISTSMPTAGTSLDLLYDFNSDVIFDFGGDPLANLVLAVYGITDPTSDDCQPNGIPDECEEDCNSNGIPDDCEDFCNDRSRGFCIPDCNENGIPDSCEEPDCNDNDIPDECDICPDPRRGCSDDCNNNQIPDECEDLEDCNDNGIPDVCEAFKDCNRNDMPDECEDLPDCNDNGLPDICDLCREEEALRGNDCSHDCNGNDVPDECEEDCNENGIPDDCEELEDCNENGIPDECEEFEDCNANGIPDECDGGCPPPPEEEQPMDDFMTDFKTDTGQPTPCGDCGKMDPLWFLLGLSSYVGLLFVRRRARY